MTNGENILSAFSNATIRRCKNKDFTYIEVEQNDKWIADFDMEWWNAEYKEPTTKNDLGVDCVSRQFMYDLGATCVATRDENGKLIALGAIEELPSVALEQESILDEIRAEIEKEIIPRKSDQYDHEAMWQNMGLRIALKTIDKYKAESEESK